MVMFLDEAGVRENLDLAKLIDSMALALEDFSKGAVLQPVRQFLNVPEHNGFFGVMPARARDMGIKLVTFYPDNAARDMHTHHALVILFDPETGEPQAVMDGGLITQMRTAAVSAAATRLLAAPEASSLCLIGSGVQAESHLAMMKLIRPIEDVRVWSPTTAHAEAFAEKFDARASSLEEAVRGADIIVTATPSKQPLVEAAWVKPGAHINAVGWNGYDSRELADDLMRSCPVFVESREGAMQECGDIIQSGAEIAGEIGQVICGDLPAPSERTTIFESTGMAIEDVASAAQIYASVSG